jgi:ATP-dependent DNA ligase
MSDREIDPNVAIDFMLKHAEQYAVAKANRIFVEEYRKTLKAELMKDALSRGFEAVNAQEREAYSHPKYKQHLKDIQTAHELEITLDWQLIAARARVDVWRTQEASNRTIDKVTM